MFACACDTKERLYFGQLSSKIRIYRNCHYLNKRGNRLESESPEVAFLIITGNQIIYDLGDWDLLI